MALPDVLVLVLAIIVLRTVPSPLSWGIWSILMLFYYYTLEYSPGGIIKMSVVTILSLVILRVAMIVFPIWYSLIVTLVFVTFCFYLMSREGTG